MHVNHKTNANTEVFMVCHNFLGFVLSLALNR